MNALLTHSSSHRERLVWSFIMVHSTILPNSEKYVSRVSVERDREKPFKTDKYHINHHKKNKRKVPLSLSPPPLRVSKPKLSLTFNCITTQSTNEQLAVVKEKDDNNKTLNAKKYKETRHHLSSLLLLLLLRVGLFTCYRRRHRRRRGTGPTTTTGKHLSLLLSINRRDLTLLKIQLRRDRHSEK